MDEDRGAGYGQVTVTIFYPSGVLDHYFSLLSELFELSKHVGLGNISDFVWLLLQKH